MRKTILHSCGVLLTASCVWSSAASADAVLYTCTSNAHSGVVYLKLDEKLKTASMGRSEDGMLAPDPAIFIRDDVTWSHLIEKGLYWNYTFVPATGALTYGPVSRADLSQQDICKKK